MMMMMTWLFGFLPVVVELLFIIITTMVMHNMTLVEHLVVESFTTSSSSYYHHIHHSHTDSLRQLQQHKRGNDRILIVQQSQQQQQSYYRSNHQHQHQHQNTVHNMYVSSSIDRLFPTSIYDTIQQGKIAIVSDFISKDMILKLKMDAQDLYHSNYYTTDALASYGTNGTFDPSKDRSVLKLSQWKDTTIGNYNIRKQFSSQINDLRTDLSYHLNRPGLINGKSVTDYGNGSTEISYTRFGPGAFLKRHVDEHHEEFKGINGWSQPTRRSISWLIYLNENWNIDKNGGCLQCYERNLNLNLLNQQQQQQPQQQHQYYDVKTTATISNTVGSRNNGDLQIGWLRPTFNDPKLRPVFLDAQFNTNSNTNNANNSNNEKSLIHQHYCAMYIDDPTTTGTTSVSNNNNNINNNYIDSPPPSRPYYITNTFNAHPILFITGNEYIIQKFFITKHQNNNNNNNQNNNDYSNRFYFIESSKSIITDWYSKLTKTEQQNNNHDETIVDVAPLAGTLVMFDSVSLPHEVLPSIHRSRYATSGWMHEDQQSIHTHPFYSNQQ